MITLKHFHPQKESYYPFYFKNYDMAVYWYSRIKSLSEYLIY